MFKCVASVLLFALLVAGFATAKKIGKDCGSTDECVDHAVCKKLNRDESKKCVCKPEYMSTDDKTDCVQPIDKLKGCLDVGQPKAYDDYLTDLLNQQIDLELTAQYSYLRLAHLFQQPYLYYPKFADFFREKSMEEMTHAEDFMDYQTQRGVQRSESFKFKTTENLPEACKNIDSLYDGFKCAQDLEITVTKALTQLVSDVSSIEYNHARLCTDSTPDDDVDDCKVLYNEALRKGQATLVKTNSITMSLMGATESTETITSCDDLKFDYIELAEHISHEYLGHQIKDTKVLANAVATLGRCAKTAGFYDGYNAFDNTCVFAVERLLKLE